jgi:hypothetical protein
MEQVEKVKKRSIPSGKSRQIFESGRKRIQITVSSRHELKALWWLSFEATQSSHSPIAEDILRLPGADRLKGGAIVVMVVVIDGSQGHIRVPHVFELLIVFRQQSFLLIIVSSQGKPRMDAARDRPPCTRETAVFLHHRPDRERLSTFSIHVVEHTNAVKPERQPICFHEILSFFHAQNPRVSER